MFRISAGKDKKGNICLRVLVLVLRRKIVKAMAMEVAGLRRGAQGT